jgi:hypothetical protein
LRSFACGLGVRERKHRNAVQIAKAGRRKTRRNFVAESEQEIILEAQMWRDFAEGALGEFIYESAGELRAGVGAAFAPCRSQRCPHDKGTATRLREAP